MTSSLTCGLRIVYLINLKNLICVDIINCQVKFCLLLDFFHIILFIINLASTGGPHEISRRAACGPRAAGWTALSYRIAVLVRRCLLGSAPGYLCELCRPVSGLPGRRARRSSVTGQLLVPRAKTSATCRQRRTFSIVGPSTWNELPLEIRLLPKKMKVRFAGCLRLICIAVAGLWAPLSRFLEGAPYTFLNE